MVCFGEPNLFTSSRRPHVQMNLAEHRNAVLVSLVLFAWFRTTHEHDRRFGGAAESSAVARRATQKPLVATHDFG
jgi:hypothetical protein